MLCIFLLKHEIEVSISYYDVMNEELIQTPVVKCKFCFKYFKYLLVCIEIYQSPVEKDQQKIYNEFVSSVISEWIGFCCKNLDRL